MVKFIESELMQLRSEVYQMWTLVCNQMDQARQAVLGMNKDIASQVMVRERRVDAFEDYADGIARFVRDSDAESLCDGLAEELRLREMFSGVLEMMKDLQQALVDEDPVKATSVISMDDSLDKIKSASADILVRYATAHPDSIALCMGLAGVFRKLERTGDHLTNIAEEIVFFIDAKVLKHTAGGDM